MICKNLKIAPEVERVHIAAAKYKLTKTIYIKENNLSTLGEGLNVEVGSFTSDGYAQDLDPETGLPALRVTNGSDPGVLIGDVNLNGTVEFADISALMAYIMRAYDLNEQAMLNADANFDGEVNILDVSFIYAIIFSI